MISSILKAKQDEFFEIHVDYQKRRYLKQRESFIPTVILFDFAIAYIVPLLPRDDKHKEALYASISLAMLAKKIKRYGYLFDCWGAESEDRSKLPEYLGDLPADQRKEYIWYGMVGSQGEEFSIVQSHDSAASAFVGRAARATGDLKMEYNRFAELMPKAGMTWNSGCGYSATDFWAEFKNYHKDMIEVPL